MNQTGSAGDSAGEINRQQPGSRARLRSQGISPRLKLLSAIVIITGTALLPRQPDGLYFIPAAVLFVIWLTCGMPIGYTIRRLLVAECFIIGIAVLSLLHPAARPMVVAALIKSNLCIVTMLLLTWTTPFHDILEELRRLRLPSIMLTTLALMYRYLPVLVEESRRMQRARAARSFTTRRRFAWPLIAAIIGQLFIRSAERAERIYLAMCARGWK